MDARLFLVATLLLSGCASSVEGVRLEPVNQTYVSAKAPLDIARCLQEGTPGLDIELGDGEVSVSNRNQFGAILLNWLIRETETGSLIELRRTNSITGGIKGAEDCF